METVSSQAARPGQSTETQLHVESNFEFSVGAAYKEVIPLFGAFKERCWAGDGWNPEFVYPNPPRDVFGEVFTVGQGHDRRTWVNTALDFDAGHIQYVNFVPNSLTTLIEIHVMSIAKRATRVRVQYQFTALRPELIEHVKEMARKHNELGPQWAKEIEACLARSIK